MKLRTYSLTCREHANNIGSKKITMTNKVIRNKSRYAQCFMKQKLFMKQKFNKKVVSSIIKQS